MSPVRVILVSTLCALCLTASARSARVSMSGPITHDTVWAGPDTVVIPIDVSVQPGVRLTIGAGTVVMTCRYRALQVQGELRVIGTADDPVEFTALSDTAGGAPSPGDWLSIKLRNNSKAALDFCEIHYATQGVDALGSSFDLYGCTIDYFLSKGIMVTAGATDSVSKINITHCLIDPAHKVEASLTGVYCYSEMNVNIANCRITACDVGVEVKGCIEGAPVFDITDCEISRHDSVGLAILTSG